MRWEDREVGTFLLYQFVRPGSNGETKDLGQFRSLREAIEAARLIAPHSKLEGEFSVSEKYGTGRRGAAVEGRNYRVSLEPAAYFPDQELTLSDGRVVWLGDVDAILRERLDAYGIVKRALGCTGGHTNPGHVCEATA